jgi:hypothetical protein
MKMQKFYGIGRPQNLRISDELSSALAPSLGELCSQRDTFNRIAFGVSWDEPLEFPLKSWQNLVREVQKILMRTGIAADASQLCQQPPGSFVGFNRISGASLAGRVF